jgi:ubiquinone/menaquinone biosynthesis C-methylase UbiE
LLKLYSQCQSGIVVGNTNPAGAILMHLSSLLACPRCLSGRLQDGVEAVVCRGCGEAFPKHFGVIDFRNEPTDRTADFSVKNDSMLAAELSKAFHRTSTFNELRSLYEFLRDSPKQAQLLGADSAFLLREAKVAPRPLTHEQLAHGPAILEKLEQYTDTTLPPPLRSVALENGCGFGYYIDGFARHFSQLIVVDLCLCFLLLGRKIVEERKLNNVTFVCASVERLPLQNEAIDFIHSNNVIEHVGDQEAMLREAKRVLKSKGLLLVLSPNRFSAYFEPHFRLPFYGFIPRWLRRKLIRVWQRRDPDAVSLLSLRELRALLASQFGNLANVAFVPRHLHRTVTGGTIRALIVAGLNSRLFGDITHFIINKVFLGIMPYHVALCYKQEEGIEGDSRAS